jgi:hypothetical protein
MSVQGRPPRGRPFYSSAARGGLGAGGVGSADIERAGGGGHQLGMSEQDIFDLALARSASGSGGGRGEAIRNIYYSDRQLPPGHDPGADSGEAPTAGSVAHGH